MARHLVQVKDLKIFKALCHSLIAYSSLKLADPNLPIEEGVYLSKLRAQAEIAVEAFENAPKDADELSAKMHIALKIARELLRIIRPGDFPDLPELPDLPDLPDLPGLLNFLN